MARSKKARKRPSTSYRKACDRALASGRNNGFVKSCRKRFGKG